jgi:hypothetical protein
MSAVCVCVLKQIHRKNGKKKSKGVNIHRSLSSSQLLSLEGKRLLKQRSVPWCSAE